MEKTSIVMAEAVVPYTIAEDVLEAFEARPAAMSPQLTDKDENHSAVTVGFKSRRTFQKFVGEMEMLFPGQISWR